MLKVPRVGSETSLSQLSQNSIAEDTPREIFFKFILIGDAGVGKTSILQRFTENHFDKEYNVTVGAEFGSKTIEIDDRTTAKLQIWDTAGQESFINIVRSFYHGSQGVFFVYNVNKRSSFENLKQWKEDVCENVDPSAILILMGNQADRDERQVSYDEGVEFMKEQGLHFFFETSAQNGMNIEMAFTEAARLAYLSYLKVKTTGKGIVLESRKDNIFTLTTPKAGDMLSTARFQDAAAERDTPSSGCAC